VSTPDYQQAMGRKIAAVKIKAQVGMTWAFVVRAGDGNRTRTVSLGS
jgi:hypothetical protein